MSPLSTAAPGRVIRSWLAVLATLTTVLALTGAPRAQADTAPAPGTPATVSAQALPTMQINGVVWAQAVVGTTVIATGDFTKARPAGARAGVSETDARGLVAYDIRTGAQLPAWTHQLGGGVGRAVAVSPDQRTVYVGGDFTTVDGQPRSGVVALDAATGAARPGFATTVSGGAVNALAVSATTLYLGGAFWGVGGQAHRSLAALDSATGAVNAAWNPSADSAVKSMTLTPDGSKLVVGGQFAALNGVGILGLGALEAATGHLVPWKATETIKAYGSSSVSTLVSDGTSIYGGAFSWGTTGNFEGTFRLNPQDGSIVWLGDCHGDTYSVYPSAGVLYAAGHPHDCEWIGGYPESDPRWYVKRAIALTTAATGTVTGPDDYGWDFRGLPAPTLLPWFPDLTAGNYTGMGQAAWSVTGTGDYVALGGEFTAVNGVAQQGLTRFAKKPSAALGSGPLYDGFTPRPVPVTRAVSNADGSVTISYGSAWDKDNASLRYDIIRDPGTAAQATVTTVTVPNTVFWSLPDRIATDPAPPAGSHTYQVVITDPDGNVLRSNVSAPVTTWQRWSAQLAPIMLDGPDHLWRFGERSGTTAADQVAGGYPGVIGTGVTLGRPGAVNDGDTAFGFPGTATGSVIPTPGWNVPTPGKFTWEAWFSTTTGGHLMGFGNSRTGTSTVSDRVVYVDAQGRLVLGVIRPDRRYTATSAQRVTDGAWHHVAVTMGDDGGFLYLDGRKVAGEIDMSWGIWSEGALHIGGDTLDGWPGRPAKDAFTGTIDEVVTYPYAVSASRILAHAKAAGRALPTAPPAPTDRYGAAVMASGPNLYWRLDETAGAVAANHGAQGSPGDYVAPIAHPAPGSPGSIGASADLTGGGSITEKVNTWEPGVATIQSWIRTSTTAGGAILGFSSAVTGASPKIDRQLSMLTDGRLRYTAETAAGLVTTDTPKAYNDGQWHHVVVAPAPRGTAIWVDGTPVALDLSVHTGGWLGQWRAGAEATTNGGSIRPWNGQIDEVAVFYRVLPGAEIKGLYRAAGGVASNLPPTITASAQVSGLSAVLSGLAEDRDGAVASVTWDFGDGTTGSGVTVAHRYPASGRYAATVTATDNEGAVTRTSIVVVADPPPPAVVASDTFTRTVSAGWGRASTGGPWTFSGNPADLSVDGSAGVMRLGAGVGMATMLSSVNAVNTEVSLRIRLDKPPTGGGQYVRVVGRGDHANGYLARLWVPATGSPLLSLGRAAAGAETLLNNVPVPAGVVTPGAWFRVRLQVSGSGPTTLQAKIWPDGTAEPGAWSTVATDATTSLQGPGAVGLRSYLSGSASNPPHTFAFDDLTVATSP